MSYRVDYKIYSSYDQVIFAEDQGEAERIREGLMKLKHVSEAKVSPVPGSNEAILESIFESFKSDFTLIAVAPDVVRFRCRHVYTPPVHTPEERLGRLIDQWNDYARAPATATTFRALEILKQTIYHLLEVHPELGPVSLSVYQDTTTGRVFP